MLKLIFTALVSALLGASAIGGIMLWEPWSSNGERESEQARSSDLPVLRGTMDLYDSDFQYRPRGIRCSGSGGYDDLHSGTQVLVKDGAGKVLAKGNLESGKTGANKYCRFEFTIHDVPASDFYSVAVSHRGELTYSRDELETLGWQVAFELRE